jgi:glycosyltransferase involved in cell wall biosynthesis
LDRPLAHPVQLNEILEKENRRLGLQHRWPHTVSFILKEISIADHIIIPSDFVRKTFIDKGVPESKLIQIPYGVDIEKFNLDLEKKQDSKFIALFVGQVSMRKGVHILLEVWRQLNWQNAVLWLAGRINLPKNLLEPYKELPNVRFLGHVRNIVEIYQQADVFVFPSLAEGSALVTYEAMACGLPVITTPNAGSVVRDGVDGFLEPYSDVDKIATRLELLRSDNRLRNEMGNSGREHVQSYTWHQYGERVAHAIKTLS